jgi:hypothetical protein
VKVLDAVLQHLEVGEPLTGLGAYGHASNVAAGLPSCERVCCRGSRETAILTDSQ